MKRWNQEKYYLNITQDDVWKTWNTLSDKLMSIGPGPWTDEERKAWAIDDLIESLIYEYFNGRN
tara:strand:- start:47 stop:238 length:192 start_codon:yes stop_codon:yes gene_type:complete